MSADPVRDVFRALRQSRPDADGAALLAEAERIVSARTQAAQGRQPTQQGAGGDIGVVATAMHGIQSGMLMDFDDEVFGVINAIAPVTGGGTFADRYRDGRDAAREIKAGAQAARPVTYGAGQIAGGVASGVAVAAPATAAKAVALGVGMGSAGGLGASDADLTKGEAGEALVDAAVGGVVGGVAGAIPSVAKAGLARLRGAKGAASALGAKSAQFADDPSMLDIVKPASSAVPTDAPSALRGARAITMREAEAEARRLEGVVSRDIGEGFAFEASQATGDPAAALGERMARQQAATMREAQPAANARVRQIQKWLNVQVKRVAADPESLGREDVSEAIERGTDRFFKEATATRTAEAAPLFAAAEAAAGSKRIMPTTNTVAALRAIVDDYSIGSSRGIGRALQADLDDIVEMGTGTGRLSAKDFQRLMATWAKKQANDVSISSDLAAREQKRISGMVLDAMRADLDEAADGIASGEAATGLRAARDAWARHSKNIEEHATDTVNAVLHRGQGDAATTAKWLAAKSPAQIRGVLRVLDSADPNAGAQFRAQFLEEMFVGAGKPGINADLVDELALTQVSPAKLAKSIADNYERLQVVLGDNPAAIEALRDVASVTKRLAFGAGVEGSDTAPKLWLDGAKRAAEAAAGGAGGAVVGAVGNIVGSPRTLGAALGTAEGAAAFRDAIAVTVGRKQVNAKVAGGIVAALTRAGLMAVQPSGEEQIEARRLAASRER